MLPSYWHAHICRPTDESLTRWRLSAHKDPTVHNYALSGRACDEQAPLPLENGNRVITCDRPGFGHSSQATTGHNYDTLAACGAQQLLPPFCVS
jgi:pimeloyl-ACP methyl ester carboxylesterase